MPEGVELGRPSVGDCESVGVNSRRAISLDVKWHMPEAD